MAKNKKSKIVSGGRMNMHNDELSTDKTIKLAEEKKVLEDLMNQDDFAAALTQLASMVSENLYDADTLYDGAYCYFMLCDYERAASWLNNTLQVDGGHVKARLLLARLCILEDRAESGLSIYEFLLANYGNVLKEEEKDEIRDVLDYYTNHEQEVLAGFINLQNFLNNDNEPLTAERGSDEESSPEKHKDMVEHNIADILQRPLSVQEKVRILNNFAGGHFYQGENDKAIDYLRAALELDKYNDVTLKNAAVLYAKQGNKEKALTFISHMQVTDFALISALK